MYDPLALVDRCGVVISALNPSTQWPKVCLVCNLKSLSPATVVLPSRWVNRTTLRGSLCVHMLCSWCCPYATLRIYRARVSRTNLMNSSVRQCALSIVGLYVATRLPNVRECVGVQRLRWRSCAYGVRVTWVRGYITSELPC